MLPLPVSAGHTAGCRTYNWVVTLEQIRNESHQQTQHSAVSGQETPWLEIAGAVGLALLDIFKGPPEESTDASAPGLKEKSETICCLGRGIRAQASECSIAPIPNADGNTMKHIEILYYTFPAGRSKQMWNCKRLCKFLPDFSQSKRSPNWQWKQHEIAVMQHGLRFGLSHCRNPCACGPCRRWANQWWRPWRLALCRTHVVPTVPHVINRLSWAESRLEKWQMPLSMDTLELLTSVDGFIHI